MKLGLSLWGKVLLLAALNVVLVAGLLTAFVSTQLKQDIGALLLGDSREHITKVAMQFGNELPRTARKDRAAMLERYSQAHGVTFRLLDRDGRLLAGPPVELPRELEAHLEVERARTPLLENPQNLARLAEQNRAALARGMAEVEAGRPWFDPFLTIVKDPPLVFYDAGNYWVVLRMALRSLDDSSLSVGPLVLSSPSFFGTPFFFNARPWIVLAALVLLIVLACWPPFARRATRAIADLAAATGRIAAGNFGARAQVRGDDELGQLAASFNRMAAQLDNLVHGQKGFLRDAAHELRSPLARMQAALGNILESPRGAAVEPYLEDLREEIELMSALTGELLTFAREEDARRKLALAPVSLPEMAARVLATENPANAADVRLQLDGALSVTAHPESLFRGLSNVVRNAIHYAGDAGPVTLAAERRNGATVVTVSDRGPGIPEEALELVFTPFYRLDVSRARTTGGNGLGMAIARSCFEACQGTILCRNGNPGLEVVITLRNA